MNTFPAFGTQPYDEIDSILTAAFPPDGPGASIILVKDGQTLLRKGYGLANLEWGLPVTPETVFRIGSVTKQFTAVMILMLARQGKLALQDRIEKFLPDYPTHGHTITIEHLLTHTSGIKSYTDLPSWEKDWGKSFTLDESINYFKFQPMNFAPGQQWSYSNSGYILLGAIIEKVSGMPYAQALQNMICAPLGLASTALEQPKRLIARRASGYEKSEEGFLNAAYIDMTQPLAAGGIVSTVDDLAIWDTALHTGQLLPAADLRPAHTALVLPDGISLHYVYGWSINEYEGIEILERGGRIHGFVSHVLSVPSHRLFVAVLMNTGNPDLSPAQTAFRVALLGLGLHFPIPTSLDLAESDLVKFSGNYALEPGAEVVFTCQEGALWLAWPDQQDKTRLQSCAKDEFFNPKSPLERLKFFLDEDGKSARFELSDQYKIVLLKAARMAKTPDPA